MPLCFRHSDFDLDLAFGLWHLTFFWGTLFAINEVKIHLLGKRLHSSSYT